MTITAREKAQAAEALNRHPGLSPAARRLGIELLNRADRRTGLAWPSEARLAEALGYCERTIRRAKAELRAVGVLSWKCRGHHKTPMYALAWEALRMIGTKIKEKLKATFLPAPLAATRAGIPSGRTSLSSYLTQSRFKGALEGKGLQTPTDQQLNVRAHGRLWTALRNLSHLHMTQLIDRITEHTEAEAVKAERYQPGTGLLVLERLLKY
jgi:hypothetical protein